jgi:hypothetical protein
MAGVSPITSQGGMGYSVDRRLEASPPFSPPPSKKNRRDGLLSGAVVRRAMIHLCVEHCPGEVRQTLAICEGGGPIGRSATHERLLGLLCGQGRRRWAHNPCSTPPPIAAVTFFAAALA